MIQKSNCFRHTLWSVRRTMFIVCRVILIQYRSILIKLVLYEINTIEYETILHLRPSIFISNNIKRILGQSWLMLSIVKSQSFLSSIIKHILDCQNLRVKQFFKKSLRNDTSLPPSI